MAYRKGAFDPERVRAIEGLGFDADVVLAACASVALSEGRRVVDVVDEWLDAKRLLDSNTDVVDLMMPDNATPTYRTENGKARPITLYARADGSVA